MKGKEMQEHTIHTTLKDIQEQNMKNLTEAETSLRNHVKSQMAGFINQQNLCLMTAMSGSRLSRLLSADRNFTLADIITLLHALDSTVVIEVYDRNNVSTIILDTETHDILDSSIHGRREGAHDDV